MRLLLVYTLLGYILTSQVAAETTWAKMLEDFNPEEEMDSSSKEYKLMEYKLAQCETKVLWFDYEKSKIEENCENQVQNLTQENSSKLQAIIQQHEEQISTLKREHQEDVLNKDKSMKNSSLLIKFQKCQDENEELKLQLANITEINNEIVKILGKQHQEALDQILHIEELKRRDQEHQEEIRSLKLQHEKDKFIDNPDLCIDTALKENLTDILNKFNFIDNTVIELQQNTSGTEEKVKKIIENQISEMDSLKHRQNESLKNFKNEQEEILNKKIQSLQDEIANKEKQHVEEVEELKLEYEADLKDMTKKSTRRESKLKKNYEEAIENLKRSHIEEILKLKNDFEYEIQNLKEQHKNEIQQFTLKQQNEIINMQTKHELQVTTFKREKLEQMTEISRLLQIKQELETNLAIYIKKHESEKEMELTLIKVQYSSDVESLKQNLSMELVNRTESYNDEMRDCKENAYNKLLTEQEQQYWLIKNGTHELAVENRRIQTSCEDTIKQMRHESQVERSEHLREKQLIQEKHNTELTERKEEIASLKQEYSARINSMETKHTSELVEKKNEIYELKQEHSKQIKSTETKHKTELDEKKKEIYDLKNEHSARVSSLEKEVRNKDENNQRLETESRSCMRDLTSLQIIQTTQNNYFCKGKGVFNLVHLGTGKYQFNKIEINWYEAQKYCRRQGLHLLVLETINEHYSIINYIRQIYGTSDDWWIGGSDEASEGSFYWANTGHDVSGLGVWTEDQPNDAGGQDCIELEYIDGAYGWNDMQCSKARYFICELDPNCM